MYSKIFTPFFKFNLILLIFFSIGVNSLIEIQNINLIFYILFHITFIYYLFYHYHYTTYLSGLFYGVFFDIILINYIGSHLLSFMMLILLYNLFKKYLFLLTSYQITITIFVTLIIILYFEITLAFLFNNIYISINLLFKYFVISLVVFIPSMYLFNKLDNWDVLFRRQKTIYNIK